MTRVGFVGSGFIARFHAMQFQLAKQPHEVVAVTDIDPDRAKSFIADEFPDAAFVPTVTELCELVDLVVVCTPTATHDGIVRDVIAANKALLCEKPLAVDLPSALKLAQAVEDSGIVNVVGLVLRTSPAMIALKELIHLPEHGKVLSVIFRDDQYIPIQGMYGSTWRSDPAQAGSGTLLEHSIHDVDILEWLIGPLSTVNAHQQFNHGITGIEDVMTVLGVFDSGATVSLTSVWHDILSRPSSRRIEVFCENALITLEGDFFGPVLCQTSDELLELTEETLVPWLESRDITLESSEDQLLKYLDSINTSTNGGPKSLNTAPSPTVHDAVRAHLLVDRIYEAARTQSTVTIPAGNPL